MSFDNTPPIRPERLKGPIGDRQRVFLAVDNRHALAVAEADGTSPRLTIAVCGVDDHPFDFWPAWFDRERIRELHAALGEWLERTA